MAPLRSNRRLVLVVDSDARTARLLAQLLREDGFDVDTASNSAAARVRLGRAPLPDALVTDVTLLHGDVVTMVREARSRSRQLPVLFVTGHPEIARRAAQELDPVPALFIKPLEYEPFAKALGAALQEDGKRIALP